MAAHGADTVILAVGATPRRPVIPGADGDNVVLAVDLVNGHAAAGQSVALVVEDDGPAPPTIAHHLATEGHDVTVVFQTADLAPGVGKYSIGSMLAELDHADVTAAAPDRRPSHRRPPPRRRAQLQRANRSDWARSTPSRSSVAPRPRTDLRDRLADAHPDVRVIGDAYAPQSHGLRHSPGLGHHAGAQLSTRSPRPPTIATAQEHLMTQSWITDSTPSERFPFYTRANVGEIAPKPMSPLSWDLVWKHGTNRGYADGHIRWGSMDADEVAEPNTQFACFGGYLYINWSMIRVHGRTQPGHVRPAHGRRVLRRPPRHPPV